MAPARRGNVRVYAAVMALVGALGLFVPAASGESALAPESFQPERTGAVLILSPVEGATYSASLSYKGACDTDCPVPTQTSATGKPGSQSLALEITLPANQQPGAYELVVEVSSSDGGAPRNLLTREIQVSAEKPLMFVETDKPVYKPGATIHVRSVCLLPSLKPCTDQKAIRLVLMNPEGTKVLANGTTEAAGTGVFEGSLQLDSRAPLGSWSVVAEGENLSAELDVEVDEYVLPKFEVQVSVDQDTVIPSTGALTGQVSAIYSYGKGVEGTVTLRLKREMLPWGCTSDVPEADAGVGFMPRLPDVDPKDCQPVLVELADAKLGPDGIYSFDMPLPDNLDTWGTLELEASVVEAATGVEANGTATVTLSPEPYYQFTVSGPTVYYPGLYIDLDVTSEMSDGTPVPGTFKVTAEFSTYVPDDWKAPEGEAQLPRSLVTTKVKLPGGTSTVQLQAPKQPDCCLSAISANVEGFDWSKTACCWSTVNPTVTRVDDGAKDLDTWQRQATGSCMEPAFPPSRSYLAVKRTDASSNDVTSGKVLLNVTASGDVTRKSLFYVLTAQGSFVSSSPVSWSKVNYNSKADVTTGIFEIEKSPAMVPVAHVVVAFSADDGSLVAGESALELDTAEDLKLLQSRPVHISTNASVPVPPDRDYYEPGEEVLVELHAEPSSVVFLGAVDRSVKFMTDKNSRISAERLLDAFKSRIGMDSMPVPPGPPPCAAWGALENAGLRLGAPEDHPEICLLRADSAIFTDNRGRTVQGPKCYNSWLFRGEADMGFVAFAMPAMAPLMEDGALGMAADNGRLSKSAEAGVQQQPLKVRTKFPETWIWRSATVDSTGAHSFLEVAPDSITTWELSGFSVSSTAGLGLGRGDPTEIKVFKPLFVDLKLPYKVIRGEVLEVVASVFNYLPEAQDVRLGLTVPAGQKGITIPADGQMRDLAVEANGAASFKVNITFDELGTAKLQLEGRSLNGAADSVVKSLKVVPEGFKQQSTINIMLQPPATGSQKETVPVRVDDVMTLVPGSEYASLILAGELLGPSLDGLGSLVQLPMGCGEQNMLIMAPTVYVMRYLNSRQEMRPDLKEKALGFIQVGYSRELEYRHPDGSFSAFGTSDDSGSTWLTAFVLKVFSQAHSAQLLEVSPDIAGAAASWLLNEAQDKETGQFQPRGRVIHSEMVGGVQEGDASVSLSAFVTGALLEARVAKLLPESGEAALEKALSYLISAPWETNYAKVLVAHNLALASSQEPMVAVPGLKDAASQAFQEMLALGIEEGTTTHWAPKPSSSPESSSKLTKCADCYVAHASGPEVEMTGYALSAMVQTLGEAALADAFGVAKWLLSERSPSGGWRSTQDTVVALEGLSGYAAKSSASPPSMVVTVSYEEPSTSTRKMLSQVSKTLNINADNYDILQKLDLPVGQEVSVTIKGTGKAIMTIGTFWHTKALPLEPTFNVVSEATRKDGTTSVLQKVEIERVSGSGEGMIIASLQVFSGMVPEPLSLSGLKGSKSACNGAVKRVDYANDEVSVYIDGIAMGDAPCQLELKLQEDMPVKNLQPAAVEVFEYYDPQKSGAAETSSDIKVVLDFDSPDGSTNSASPASVAITFGHALLAAAAYLYLAN